MGISKEEMHEALGFAMIPEAELAGFVGFIMEWADTDKDGTLSWEEIMGIREMLGDDISAEEWGALEAAFAYADASGNQNNSVSFGELMDMLNGMRDAINEMGGVDGLFDMMDS